MGGFGARTPKHSVAVAVAVALERNRGLDRLERNMFAGEQGAFPGKARGESAQETRCRNDAMTGNKHRDRVGTARAAHGSSTVS